jgi:Tfp pilus assembly protein PilX
MREASEPMKKFQAILKDERGVAVVVAMVALLALTALVVAFLAVSAFEPQISANLTAGAQARYLAEAGIEAAFDGLAATPDWNTALVGATCATGVAAPTTAVNSTLPGLTAASGTFTVTVRNDCFAGSASVSADSVLTGVALEASATADTNNRVMVTSTGRIADASGTVATRVVKTVIKKVILPPINGALTFPGVQADVDFSGSSFVIRGIDTNMDGSDGPGSPVYGIAVGVAANEAGVDSELANNQQNSVTGKSQTNPSTTTSGVGTVAFDTGLTSAAVTDFVNAIKANADISINSPASNPFSINNVGSSCATNVNSSTCWGTPSHPKIVYVKGDGTGQYNALDVSGNSSGTGILIVENANLDITGTFNWNGPVIVTGTNVKIRYHGGGNQSIFGTVVVNELNNDGAANLEADISGNASIFYSSQANNLVMNGLGGRRLMSIYSWQEQ